MRVSEKDVMELLSILDGTITDADINDETIGGYSYYDRKELWERIRNQQSKELIDLEHGGKLVSL